MFVTGHLSAAFLFHRLTGAGLLLVAAGSVFPDLVDKSLQAAGVFISGRHVTHNLFALFLTTLFVGCWRGKRAGMAWFGGYALHLLGDLPLSWAMPWFFPLNFGTWHHSVETGFMNLSTGQVVFDLAVTSTGLFVMGWDWIQKWEKRGADGEQSQVWDQT